MIRADQARPGDVVRLDSLAEHTVKSLGHPEMLAGKLYIETASRGGLILNDADEIELRHRPWPHGATEADMENRIVLALANASKLFGTDQRPQALARLRDAIDDYLMGRNV